MTDREDLLDRREVVAAFPALVVGAALSRFSTEQLVDEVVNRTEYRGTFVGRHITGGTPTTSLVEIDDIPAGAAGLRPTIKLRHNDENLLLFWVYDTANSEGEMSLTISGSSPAAAIGLNSKAFIKIPVIFTAPDPTPVIGVPTGGMYINESLNAVRVVISGAWVSLQYAGGPAADVTTVTTTSHAAGTAHVILVDDDTAGSTVTVTLPAASASEGFEYRIKKLGTTANVVVDPDGAETIDGAATATLAVQYEAARIVSDGSNWWVI